MRVGASSGNLVGAAGIGVGVIVGCLTYLGLMPYWSGVALLVTAVPFTILAFVGANVARRQERNAAHIAAATQEPDVSLRFNAPNEFILHNYGAHAIEVEIETLRIAEYVSDVWKGRRITTAEQVMRFPTVDIDAEESVLVPPTQSYLGSELTQQTALGFLQAIIKKRQTIAFWGRELPEPNEANRERYLAEMDDRLRKQTEPVDLELTLRYSNRSLDRRWEKTETLHYEPRDGTVRVIHGPRREVTA